MSTIGIIGGTGFVGKHLSQLLVTEGHNVTVFSRNPKAGGGKGITNAQFDYSRKLCDIDALKKLDSVVCLAGAGVADKRWSQKRKEEIISSRVDNTNYLLEQLQAHAPNCKTFVAASATGIYGPDKAENEPFHEDAPPFNDFLGETCKQWEAASLAGTSFMRTTVLRFGIVLGKESGAFPEFTRPMKFGVMPILGGGQQKVSWIEVDDLARMISFALATPTITGVYNAVAPEPVTHKKLMQAIAGAMGGIKIPVPVPSFALKIMLGELSIEILKSCNVSSQKIISSGFTFKYPGISAAAKAILGK